MHPENINNKLQILFDEYDNPCTVNSRCVGDDRYDCDYPHNDLFTRETAPVHCYCVGGILAIHNRSYLKEHDEDLYTELSMGDYAFPNVNEFTNLIVSIFDVPNTDKDLDTVNYYASKIITNNDSKEFDKSRFYMQKLFETYHYEGQPIEKKE